jgi:inosine-uridine nucleoside N-ribohydrolase
MGTRLSRYLLPSIEPWFKLNLKIPFLPWKGGFVPWDVVATSVVVIPEAFSDLEMMHLDVKPLGLARGRVFPDISRQVPPTQVPTDVDSEAVLRSLLDCLESLD